jgi:hypothetical protein
LNNVHEKEMTTEKAQDALNQLSEGRSTINQVRTELGLKPLDDESANELYVTKE